MTTPTFPQYLSRIAFAIALCAVFVLALLPAPAGLNFFSWQDKAEHLLIFLVLSLVGMGGWPRARGRVALAMLVYGVAMEVAQSFTGYRVGDPLDWVADALGAGLALITFALRRRQPPT